MTRQRFRYTAAIVVAGLAVSSLWMVARRGHPQPSGETIALEPLFQRVVVAAGDDPTAFPVAIQGAQLIEIDRTGALLVYVGPGVKRQPSPRAYQDIDGRRRAVSVHFEIAPVGDPRFVVGPYDRASPLVIESQPGKD